MLLWIFNKQTKSFSLIGTYKSIGCDDYIGPDDESFVKIGDCCYELSKRFVNSFFNCLAVNPFKDYRFMVNREMFEEYGNNKFPVGGKYLGAELYEITKDGHITRNGFPTYPSSSTTVSLLMQFYHVVGYESITGRTDGEHGIDHLIEEGYTPTYYYAGNGSCCLLVRERNAVRTAPSLNEVPELLAIIKKK